MNRRAEVEALLDVCRGLGVDCGRENTAEWLMHAT